MTRPTFIKFFIISIILGILSASATSLLILNYQTPTENELIKDFYRIETAVHVSPHTIRKEMSKGEQNFILVDLRSREEYEKEHIIGAINIPAYKDPDTSAYGDKERIVMAFSKLPKDKDIIVYCYSTACMTGRKIGAMLADNGIYVKHLGIGWNEWRYYWNSWNHEHEWEKTNVENYIQSGKEAGKYNQDDSEVHEACAINNEFGC